MSEVEFFSIIASVASITLAVVSIWLARSSVRESQASSEKTTNTLNQINERSAGTEKIVGEHFDKLMGTVLSIVNTATTGPEVRKAELELKEKEQQAKMQEQLFKMMADTLNSGDPKRLQQFLEMGETFSRMGTQQRQKPQ